MGGSRYSKHLKGDLLRTFEEQMESPLIFDCREDVAVAQAYAGELLRTLSAARDQDKPVTPKAVGAVVAVMKEIVTITDKASQVLDRIGGMITVEEAVKLVQKGIRDALRISDFREASDVEDIIDKVLERLPISTPGQRAQEGVGVQRVAVRFVDTGANRLSTGTGIVGDDAPATSSERGDGSKGSSPQRSVSGNGKKNGQGKNRGGSKPSSTSGNDDEGEY